MQDEISSREFAEWQAYYRLEPFGERVTDVRLANLLALIASGLGGKKVDPKDMLVEWGAGEDEVNDEMVANKVMAIFGRFKK